MKLLEISVVIGRGDAPQRGTYEGIYIGQKIAQFFEMTQDTRLVKVKPNVDSCGGSEIKDIGTSEICGIIEQIYSSGDWWFVKSKTSCRFFFVGYDLQIFLCIKHGDDMSFLVDRKIKWEECSDLLIESDIFDGF